MRRSSALAAVILAAATSSGCGDHEFHPPSEEERLSVADSLYSPAAFDTLTWASDQERIQAGNLVYADECRRCHGPVGRGHTDYAVERDLEVPSLVEPEWELARDLAEIRRRVFTGHIGGMPAWGVAQLTPRQVDAVAFYIINQLRPEVLSDSTHAPAPLETDSGG